MFAHFATKKMTGSLTLKQKLVFKLVVLLSSWIPLLLFSDALPALLDVLSASALV